MALDPRSRVGLVGVLAVVAIAVVPQVAGAGAVVDPSCGEFASQADAQIRFAELGGAPRHTVGDLDGDRDGIACEGLPAPYAAYATLGYNRRGGFLYGMASMPPAAGGKGKFPCLSGNRKGPLGPRRLNVYRVRKGDDHPLFGLAVRAEARADSGRLFWKAPRATLPPGRYYVAFEESIRASPYGRNPCPAFSSRDVQLPQTLQPATS